MQDLVFDATGVRVATIADAIRWACIWEASAAKPGNVHPAARFADLCYGDFVAAADITADALTRPDRSMPMRMSDAIVQCRRAIGSNANLGIVLLMGPMVEHFERTPQRETGTPSQGNPSRSISANLSRWSPAEGGVLAAAMATVGGGGVDDRRRTIDSCRDVRLAGEHYDFLAAMRSVADRDRIAAMYDTGFEPLFSQMVPRLRTDIARCGLHLGILSTFLWILGEYPDSLIARKCGDVVARDVSARASRVVASNAAQVQSFDDYLRSDGNRLNPGTTADLIAAALLAWIIESNFDKISGH